MILGGLSLIFAVFFVILGLYASTKNSEALGWCCFLMFIVLLIVVYNLNEAIKRQDSKPGVMMEK